MRISFTTLGSPSWDLDTVIRQGAAIGFDGVDFRGLQENIEITLLAEFTIACFGEAYRCRRRE